MNTGTDPIVLTASKQQTANHDTLAIYSVLSREAIGYCKYGAWILQFTSYHYDNYHGFGLLPTAQSLQIGSFGRKNKSAAVMPCAI